MVVKSIAEEIGLENITTEHSRLENHYMKYDFIVSRAVASLDDMVSWVWKNILKEGFNDLPNGILYLKGGTIEQLSNKSIKLKYYPLNHFFEESFFESKYLVHLFI